MNLKIDNKRKGIIVLEATTRNCVRGVKLGAKYIPGASKCVYLKSGRQWIEARGSSFSRGSMDKGIVYYVILRIKGFYAHLELILPAWGWESLGIPRK